MNRKVCVVLLAIAGYSAKGCDGGLQGTGAGPATRGTLIELPKRVLPHIRQSHIRQSLQVAHSTWPGVEGTERATAIGRDRLSPVVSTVEQLRQAAQEELVLLNNVFDELKSQCLPLSEDPYVVVEGNLSASYTFAITSYVLPLENSKAVPLTIAQSRWLEAVKARARTVLTFDAIEFKVLPENSDDDCSLSVAFDSTANGLFI